MDDTERSLGSNLRLIELTLPVEAWMVRAKDEDGYVLLNVRLPSGGTRLIKVYGWTPSTNILMGQVRSADLVITATADQMYAIRINLHDEEEIEHFIRDGS